MGCASGQTGNRFSCTKPGWSPGYGYTRSSVVFLGRDEQTTTGRYCAGKCRLFALTLIHGGEMLQISDEICPRPITVVFRAC